MDLEQHLRTLGSLLDKERDAEKERFAEAHSRLSLGEREARGIAISEVEAVEESGLSGRALVTYARKDGQEIGGSKIGTGGLLRVTQKREARDDAPSGIVARRQRARLSIAFDEPPPDWALEGRVVLELQPSSTTHERLAGAVRRMADSRRWTHVLRGDEPRFSTDSFEVSDVLNPEQNQALELAEHAADFALVHGPPGTGKTTVLVELIRRAALRGEQVLAAAPSNLAVDNLVERLAAAGVDAVRVGHPARVLPSVLEHTLEERIGAHPQAQIAAELVFQATQLRADARKQTQRRGPGRFSEKRAQEREARQLLSEARELEDRAQKDVLDRAQVVLATLTGLESRALRGRTFPLAVVDEATQSVEPAAYLALLKAGRVVLAGDHLQLPPTILSPDAQPLAVSLFERLGALHPQARVTLALQHRMNEQIMRYPSDALYGGKLRAHPAVAGHSIDDKPFELIDTAGRGFEESTPQDSESKLNEGEAELAASQARRLLLLLPPADIAVIAPYDAQVQKIRQLLADVPDLEVDTVDGFQGREKEAVIVSLVRSNETGELGFLADIRRINVAITRARKKLIVIGDSATVARHPFFAGLWKYAEELGAWRSAWDL
jgi:ATP-dependent RNA/DNA helicase IGHMBP2